MIGIGIINPKYIFLAAGNVAFASGKFCITKTPAIQVVPKSLKQDLNIYC